jgi:Transcriptional regulator
MPRPRIYDDDRILEVAAQVFLEKGPRAGTALIAQRAGVSEGVLFQRFKTKAALFEAALTRETESNLWRDTLQARVGKGSPAANLKAAILALFEKLHRLVPRRMVLEGQGAHRPSSSKRKIPPIEDAAAIEAYLEAENRLGRLKLSRPDLHAHEIVGAVVHCTMLTLRHKAAIGTPEEWADHLVKVHLPTPPTRVSRSKSSNRPQ